MANKRGKSTAKAADIVAAASDEPSQHANSNPVTRDKAPKAKNVVNLVEEYDSSSSGHEQPPKKPRAEDADSDVDIVDVVKEEPTATASPSATPPAIPQDIGELIKAMKMGFDRIESRMDSQDEKISGMTASVQLFTNSFQNKLREQKEQQAIKDGDFQKQLDELNKSLAKLNTSSATSAPPSSSSPGDPWAAAAAARRAPATASSTTTSAAAARPPPASGPPGPRNAASASARASSAPRAAGAAGSVDRRVVWVKGFPRDLLTRQLLDEGNRILRLIPHFESNVEVKALGFGRIFRYTCETPMLAKELHAELCELEPVWKDPRTGESTALRFSFDKSLPVRLKDRLYGLMWKKLIPHVEQAGGRLGQSRGRLWLIREDGPSELLSASVDIDDMASSSISANFPNLAQIGVAEDTARAWIRDALAEIA